jgi:hypothetical protein
LLLSDGSPSSVDDRNKFEAWYSRHLNESPLKVIGFVQWERVVEDSWNSTDTIGFVAYQQIL